MTSLIRILLPTLLFLTSCSNHISSEKIEWAEDKCADNGGIDFVLGKSYGEHDFRARCNDGAFYSSWDGEE